MFFLCFLWIFCFGEYLSAPIWPLPPPLMSMLSSLCLWGSNLVDPLTTAHIAPPCHFWSYTAGPVEDRDTNLKGVYLLSHVSYISSKCRAMSGCHILWTQLCPCRAVVQEFGTSGWMCDSYTVACVCSCWLWGNCHIELIPRKHNVMKSCKFGIAHSLPVNNNCVRSHVQQARASNFACLNVCCCCWFGSQAARTRAADYNNSMTLFFWWLRGSVLEPTLWKSRTSIENAFLAPAKQNIRAAPWQVTWTVWP